MATGIDQHINGNFEDGMHVRGGIHMILMRSQIFHTYENFTLIWSENVWTKFREINSNYAQAISSKNIAITALLLSISCSEHARSAHEIELLW